MARSGGVSENEFFVTTTTSGSDAIDQWIKLVDGGLAAQRSGRERQLGIRSDQRGRTTVAGS